MLSLASRKGFKVADYIISIRVTVAAPDIVCLTEPFLWQDISDSSVSLLVHSLSCFDRALTCPNGGIAVQWVLDLRRGSVPTTRRNAIFRVSRNTLEKLGKKKIKTELEKSRISEGNHSRARKS